jgi:hypothetical protein
MAIRNYFRAFEQRSRWVREDLLITGDLEKYEERLKEEWKYRFEQMKDELGEQETEERKKKLAKKLYKWVETGDHPLIKPRCTEPFVSRGSLQILSDKKQVGWHPEFKNRLEQVLLGEEANE